MPMISVQNVTEYLVKAPRHNGETFETFNKKTLLRYKTLRSYRLWREDHIYSLRYLSLNDEVALVRCLSLASFEKQGTEYDTFVAFSKLTTKVLYGHCHCIAGLGEACTHVAGLLFAIHEFVSEGLNELPDDLTSTDKLCRWVVPKGQKDGPQKVNNISFRKLICQDQGESQQKTTPTEVKDQRAKQDQTVDLQSAKSLFHNLVAAGSSEVPAVKILETYFQNNQFISDSSAMSISECQSAVPCMSLSCNCCVPGHEIEVTASLLPPNISERVSGILATDNCTTDSCNLVNSLAVDRVFIERVEEVTRGQSVNSMWSSYRRYACTASNMKAVCTRVDSFVQGRCSNGGSVLYQITGTSTFLGNQSTRYGHDHEATARSEFTKLVATEHINFKCIETWLVFHPCGYVGASPDGICSCDCHGYTVLEIKCPFHLKEKHPLDHKDEIDFLVTSNNSLTLNNKHNYYFQMTTTVGVVKKVWNTENCYVVIWSPKGMAVVNVKYDEAKFQEILAKSKIYFENFVLPVILQKYTDTEL